MSTKITGVALSISEIMCSSTAESAPKLDTSAMRPGKQVLDGKAKHRLRVESDEALLETGGGREVAEEVDVQ